jgi:hypothetical protein
MKYTVSVFLIATVLLASTRAAPVPLSDDLLLDDDLVGSLASDVDVDLSSDSDLSDVPIRKHQSHDDGGNDDNGNHGGYVALNCCQNGGYGIKPNCRWCPAGTTSSAQAPGSGNGCKNVLLSSCKPCPVCFVAAGGTCQPKSCHAGKRCVTVPDHKKGQIAGNCYYF